MARTFRVVSFGFVNPGEVFLVAAYPPPNGGAYVSAKRPFIGADCAMVAQLLAHWGVESHLVGNALGDDALGRQTVHTLRCAGVHPHLLLRADLRTPFEVDIADRAGTRTFFVEDNRPVWQSLQDADLSAVDGADMLYVDWYVGEAALRVARYAHARGVPIFLNVEVSLQQPDQHRALIELATYAQCPMSDVHVHPENPFAIAEQLIRMGPRVVFVTRGRFGALARTHEALLECHAPEVSIVDTQGAGAVFSAAAIFGLLHGWPIEAVLRGATHTASRKCAQASLLVDAPNRSTL
ncbi:MAG: PfkB family carbohydrate kinase [Thermoflexales bacterium]|nr:PfkB family carbohydrate kinase [Thermoflexales bacterium]MCS7325075.1 PfkB family carbohydrate kinase [Thermoflexales bacterium]MCX7938390.1 PfkB family carbohydrate kinase [Thermoflexales bacterium]MDW8053424.1 PfkB family carbohydrate kinase [Anaerolineae bacterium]MDW8292078.1 PfkB family carbohydrate kinase [Anaerolineae bacterium]